MWKQEYKKKIKIFSVIFTFLFLVLSITSISRAGLLALSKEDYEKTNSAKDSLQADKDKHQIIPGNIYDSQGAMILENIKPLAIADMNYNKAYCHLLGNTHITDDNGFITTNLETLTDTDAEDINEHKGYSVSLTLNDELQTFAYSLTEGSRGSVVVLKRHSGQILAMTSTYAQSFDITGKDCISRLPVYNDPPTKEPVWLADYLYQLNPGSTQKMFTSLIAYETGMDDFTIDDKGYIQLGKDKIYNYDEQPFGPDFGIEDAFRESANVYFAALMNKIDIGVIRKTSSDLFLNKTINTDFGTVKNIFSFGDYTEFDIGLLGIGQKNELSTVGLALMTQATIDNELYLPHVTKNICYTDKEGNLTTVDTVEEKLLASDMVSDSSCEKVRALMENTARSSGYGMNDNILGAKSGTADVKVNDKWTNRGTLVGYNEDYIVVVSRVEDGIFGIHNKSIMEKVFNKLDDISAQ